MRADGDVAEDGALGGGTKVRLESGRSLSVLARVGRNEVARVRLEARK